VSDQFLIAALTVSVRAVEKIHADLTRAAQGLDRRISVGLIIERHRRHKKLDSGEALAATVEVYLLRVKERLKKWPERNERKLSWVSTKEAVALVEEPGIVPLLLRLMELEDDLAKNDGGFAKWCAQPSSPARLVTFNFRPSTN
jgi:hypothetical protein